MGAGLNKKAKERLNSSKREGGTELNFSECDIADFRNFGPVVAMKALVKLDLGKNQILELPPTIEQLKQLTVRFPSVRAHSLAQDLDLNGNKLIKLCPQITAFVNLKRFVIAGNAVSELPPMGGFRNMTYLDISGNKYARCLGAALACTKYYRVGSRIYRRTFSTRPSPTLTLAATA